MIKKLLILFKLARKLAKSDILNIPFLNLKIHQPIYQIII